MTSPTRRPPEVDLAQLLNLLPEFSHKRVVVLGDWVADEFVSGEISRVSREAPVLILRHQKTELAPGGGANAANNLAGLGAKVIPVGAVGRDPMGHALLEYFRGKGVDTSGVVSVGNWGTPTKSRFLAGWTHKSAQQVLRVDREPDQALPEPAARKIAQIAIAKAKKADAVLISDYGFGAVTPALVRRLPAKIVTLDSRYALLDYRGNHLTAAAPNEGELEALYHCRIGKDMRKLEELGKRTMGALGLKALLVTRGKDGMALFVRGHAPQHIPIFGADEPIDVTGAGDTVIAAFTLALAAGATFAEAARLANYAGGIVVMKRGTATVARSELEAAVRAEMAASP